MEYWKKVLDINYFEILSQVLGAIYVGDFNCRVQSDDDGNEGECGCYGSIREVALGKDTVLF